jgi:hypothetical protein
VEWASAVARPEGHLPLAQVVLGAPADLVQVRRPERLDQVRIGRPGPSPRGECLVMVGAR